MANIIANLCIEVGASGLKVAWKGKEGTNPPPGPYYYRVFWSMSDKPSAVQGSSVTLDDTGSVRVIVYDASPGAVPDKWYYDPPFTDERMSVTYEGTYTLESAGDGDPWPPT